MKQVSSFLTLRKEHKSNCFFSQSATLWTSPLFKYFLLEAFIQWIHCPPGLDVVITNRQLGKFEAYQFLMSEIDFSRLTI